MKRHYPEKPFRAPSRSSGPRWPLMLLLLLAAIPCFVELGAHSFWLDEAMSLHESESLSSVLVARGNAMAYSLLLYWTRKVFGDSTFWLRALSAASGLVCVWLCWRLALRWTSSPKAAFAAGALLVAHPLFVNSAREARTYSLWLAAFLLTLEALSRAREAKPPLRLYWASSAALVLLHNFGLFYLIGQAAFLWRDFEAAPRQKARHLLQWFYPLGILGVVLFVRLLRKTGGVIAYLERWGAESGGAPDALQRAGLQLLPSSPALEFYGTHVIGVAAVILWWAALQLVGMERSLRRFASLAFWSAVVPFATLYTLSLRMHERILLPTTAVFCLLIALSVFGRAGANRAASFAMSGVVVVLLALWVPQSHSFVVNEKEDWRAVCDVIAKQSVRGEIVIPVPQYLRYPLKQCFKGLARSPEGILRSGVPDVPQVWLVESTRYSGDAVNGWDVREFYRRKLESTYEMKESSEVRVGNLKVTRLARRPIAVAKIP